MSIFMGIKVRNRNEILHFAPFNIAPETGGKAIRHKNKMVRRHLESKLLFEHWTPGKHKRINMKPIKSR